MKPYLLFSHCFLLLISFIANPSFAQDLDWAGHFESSNASVGVVIDTDQQGNVYSAGGFVASMDADPGAGTTNLTSAGNVAFYISKVDAQGNLIWAKSIEGNDEVGGSSIKVDNNQNVVITGYFWGTADFDPGPGIFNLTSVGFSDMFYLKLNAMGEFLWAKRIGGAQHDRVNELVMDDLGFIYSTGSFSGTVDFNPGIPTVNVTSNASNSIFVNKLDAFGNFVWVKHFEGTGIAEGNTIDLDASGNVYTSGYFDETVDFDPGIDVFNMNALSPDFDVFISKLGPWGDFIWAKQIGGNYLNDCLSIEADQQGNIYLGGYFSGTTDFDPGPSVTSFSTGGFPPPANGYVCKLDTSGFFLWAKQIEGTYNIVYDISIDSENRVAVVGSFEGVCDADPGVGVKHLVSAGLEDILILKLNSSGDYLWANGFGNTNTDIALAVVSGIQNEVLVTGEFHETIDFDPGAGIENLIAPSGIVNAFICQFADDFDSVFEEEIRHNELHSYPNPSKDYFKLDANGVQNVEVYNSIGRLVKTFEANQLEYFIGDLPSGTYMLRVQTNQGTYSSSIVKLK